MSKEPDLQASLSSVLTEEKVQCSICLDVFREPVTIPCGHTFCKSCLTQCWASSRVGLKCVLCNHRFRRRPVLKVNTVIASLASSLQSTATLPDVPPGSAQPGVVPCDVCVGKRLAASKSCLVCVASFCELHLQPHITCERLQRHTLMEPADDLDSRICAKHGQPLRFYCREDRKCVCVFCAEGEHGPHTTVPLEEECKEKRRELEAEQEGIQLLILEEQKKIVETKEALQLCKGYTEEARLEGEELRAFIVRSLDKGLKKMNDLLDADAGRTEAKAQRLQQRSQQRIDELTARKTTLEQILHTQDPISMLQVCPPSSLPRNPDPRNDDDDDEDDEDDDADEEEKRLVAVSDFTALSIINETLTEARFKTGEMDMKKIQRHEVTVTLDPQTAQRYLVVSPDRKEVYNCGEKQDVPDLPGRFHPYPYVLGTEAFSAGQFYFQVQVSGKTKWAVGVAEASVVRKSNLSVTPEDGFFTIKRRGGRYFANDTFCKPIMPPAHPDVVGVFVNYEGGTVCFYDAERWGHLYTIPFLTFEEKLHVCLSPGLEDLGFNTTPLVIKPCSL